MVAVLWHALFCGLLFPMTLSVQVYVSVYYEHWPLSPQKGGSYFVHHAEVSDSNLAPWGAPPTLLHCLLAGVLRWPPRVCLVHRVTVSLLICHLPTL